jgi:hypothetical protein
MKKLIVIAAISAATMGLSACAGMPMVGTGASGDWSKAALEIAKDPNCGHTDTLSVQLGPVSTGSVFLQRSCPGPNGKAPDNSPGTPTVTQSK